MEFLREKIKSYCKENGKYVVDFPKMIHLSVGTFYNRMKTNEWTRTELKTLQQVLNLSNEELVLIINE